MGDRIQIQLPERPKKGAVVFTLAVAAPFFPIKDEVNIPYEPSKWFSWSYLREPKALASELGSSAESLHGVHETESLHGVYEVVRGWEASDTNLFLYVGMGNLYPRLQKLLGPVSPRGKVKGKEHSKREQLVNCAKKGLGIGNEDNEQEVFDWLYLRWTICTHPLAPRLLEYYLHGIRCPEYPDLVLESQQK